MITEKNELRIIGKLYRTLLVLTLSKFSGFWQINYYEQYKISCSEKGKEEEKIIRARFLSERTINTTILEY